jgi:Tfp pilus assembly protein PilF
MNRNRMAVGTRRIVRRTVMLAIATWVATSICGCASGGRKPISAYSAPTESDRSAVRAEALTKQAVELLDKDPTKAESILREAIDADIFYGPAHNNLGVLCLRQRRLFEAANEFEWAKKVMPGHPDPRFNLAMTLERAGRTDEALVMYDTALEVCGEHMPSIQAIARLQVKRGRADARMIDFLNAIALRGEAESWRTWARDRLAVGHGGTP